MCSEVNIALTKSSLSPLLNSLPHRLFLRFILLIFYRHFFCITAGLLELSSAVLCSSFPILELICGLCTHFMCFHSMPFTRMMVWDWSSTELPLLQEWDGVLNVQWVTPSLPHTHIIISNHKSQSQCSTVNTEALNSESGRGLLNTARKNKSIALLWKHKLLGRMQNLDLQESSNIFVK